MEADICDRNVSPTLVNRTETYITDVSTKSVDGLESPESVTSVVNETVTPSCPKPQYGHKSENDNDDDYYEVISADGSIGEDGVDTDTTKGQISFGIPNAGFLVSEDQSLVDKCSFDDLPFVPKFEFPTDLNRNTNETVSNYGVLRINSFISDNIPRPDKNFSIPPPNFKPSDIKHSPESVYPVFNSKVSDHACVSKGESVDSVLQGPSSYDASSGNLTDEALKNLPGPSADKESVVDWLDENGDPVPGAFDYVKPDEESSLSPKSNKIEYVFSVKEKKDLPVKFNKPSDFVNSFLINQNVLHKNIAGNLGVQLENQLVPGPSGIRRKIFEDDEEKKLYEASKSGVEYKAAVEAGPASSSTTETPPSNNAENEQAKKGRLNRFRRNRFTDAKKDDANPEVPLEEKPQKTQEEVALESQAVTEILKEVQRGAARAKEYGALGWQKCPVPVTNKTFLRNTLVSTLREPYRPPSKRGRFHVGLKGSKDKGSHDGKGGYDDDESSSSRSSR